MNPFASFSLECYHWGMQAVKERCAIRSIQPLWDDPLTAALAASSKTPPLKEGFSGRRIVFSTGRENDGTGLYYYRARYYSPRLQRFVSEDPLGFAGGDVNLYAYVGNDPVNYRDPWGLYWFRQDWQEPGVVGRLDTIVPPRGPVSEFIEQNVPAGYTFGQLHDTFVDAAISAGFSDLLVNVPSMPLVYGVAQTVEVLRSLGLLEQPTPPSPPPCGRKC